MSTDNVVKFSNEVLSRDAVEQLINDGEFMVIAGDESVLSNLPSGNWIAGKTFCMSTKFPASQTATHQDSRFTIKTR